MRLRAGVYDSSYTAPVFLNGFTELAECQVSWELPGGVRTITVAVKMSPLAAYSRFREFALQRLVLTDDYCDRPIATGDITFLGYGWGMLILQARGPWWRLYDGLENTLPTSGDDTDDMIEQALGDHASGTVSTDYSNIATLTNKVTKTLPAATCDATSAYKLKDADGLLITGGVLVGDVARDTTGGSFTTVVSLDSEGQLGLADDIFANADGYVIYRPLCSGHTTATLASGLIDAKANFLRSRCANGDYVFNFTDKTQTTINAAVAGATNLSLAADIFTIDEQYTIASSVVYWTPAYEGVPVADVISEMVGYGDGSGAPVYFWLEEPGFAGARTPAKARAHLEVYSATATADWQVWRRDLAGAPQIGRDFGNLATSVTALYGKAAITSAATNNTSIYWTRERAITGRAATSWLADEAASVYVNRESDAVLRRSWTIGARRIWDGSGFQWPLWRMLISGGYLRLNDAYPEVSLAAAGYDRERQGRIMTMDYNYRSNRMRVTLDDDTRADRRMRELGYDEAINRRLRQTMQPYL